MGDPRNGKGGDGQVVVLCTTRTATQSFTYSLSPPRILASLQGSPDLTDAVALGPLALELTSPADRSRTLAGALLGRFLVVTTQLHLAIDTFTLQLLLEGAQRLVDIIVANEDLHKRSSLSVEMVPAAALSDAPPNKPSMHKKRFGEELFPRRTGRPLPAVPSEFKV
jgi:hypothetical protein